MKALPFLLLMASLSAAMELQPASGVEFSAAAAGGRSRVWPLTSLLFRRTIERPAMCGNEQDLANQLAIPFRPLKLREKNFRAVAGIGQPGSRFLPFNRDSASFFRFRSQGYCRE